MASQLTAPVDRKSVSLLAPDEPPPFVLENPDGPAQVLLVCDHATGFIPRMLGNLGLDEPQLRRHIAWDIGIAEVTRILAARLDAPAVMSQFSRLIVDPNRKSDSESSIPQVSDEVEIPGNRNLDPAEAEARRETFFRPYHAAISQAIDRLMKRGKPPAVLFMHSFTPVMNGFERPWKIGILWDKDPRLPKPLIAKFAALGIPVGDNEPYSGRDEHGYTQHVHADDRGLANALIEIRQDLIDTHHGAAEWAEAITGVLQEVLNDPAIHHVRTYR